MYSKAAKREKSGKVEKTPTWSTPFAAIGMS